MMEETVLHGRFQMLPSCSTHYDVTLTRRNLMFVEQSTTKTPRKLTSVLMDTIIGCKMYNSKLNQDLCSYFKVITLAKGKKGTRHKRSYAFRVDEKSSREGNNKIAERWTCLISWLIINPQLPVDDLRAKQFFPPQRRFLVVINPKSGPGKSLQQFSHVIEPFLLEANIDYEVFITGHAGHLTEKTLTLDYKCLDAIVICSGDGLVYEFLNGIMKRPDWMELLKLPIGILPTGSGNALAASVLHTAKENFSLVSAIYVLLKGQSEPIDIFSVTTRSSTLYGFLSIAWGIIADIDIESEKYRAIGPLRFQVGAVQRILNLRHYNGIFSYLPAQHSRTIVGSNTEAGETEFSGSINDNGTESNGPNHIIPPRICSTGTAENAVNNCNVSNNHIQNGQILYGPTCKVPDMDDPVPDDWVTIDGEFISIVLSTMSHLGSDTHFTPGLCMGSGSLNLQIVRQGPRTRKMFQLLSAVDSGKHVDYPEVEIENVMAFRLTPEPSEVGHVCIDGELIDYEPIQGEVYPMLGRVIMIKTET